MALLPPGVAQGVLAGQQDQRELEAARQLAAQRQAAIDWQNFQITQAREQAARDKQLQQAAGAALGQMMAPPPVQQQAPAPQPPAPGQPSVPGMTGWPQAPQGAPAQPQPYQTVAGAAQAQRPPQQGPAAPPPVGQPPQQGGNTLQRVLASLKAAGVPQDQWPDAILHMKAPIGMMESDELNQLKLQIVQARAEAEAAKEAGRDRRQQVSIDASMDRLERRLSAKGSGKGAAGSGGTEFDESLGAVVAQGVPITQVSGYSAAAKTKARDAAFKFIMQQNPGMSKAEAGIELARRQMDWKARQGALGASEKMTAGTERGILEIQNDMETLDSLIDATASKFDAKFLNKSVNEIRRQTNDPDIGRLDLAAKQVAMKYERALTGGLMSVAQLHAGAQEDAKKILNGDMTPAQMRALMPLMKRELDNALKAGKKTSEKLSRMPDAKDGGGELPQGWSVKVK